MKFIETGLEKSYLIEVAPVGDERGVFFRTFCADEFREINHTKPFVQINHSITYKKGTIRGMHFQVAPFSEIKLIRCIRGKILDVIIDLRKDSETFLKHFKVELSEENRRMVYVPEGFAHGFQALEDNCELLYHHTAFYDAASERGIRYNDPIVNIFWPLPPVFISKKDSAYPFLEGFS